MSCYHENADLDQNICFDSASIYPIHCSSGTHLHGLNGFLTFRAVIAVDCVFGNFRRDIGRNVFDEAFAGLFSLVEFCATVGTVFQAMCFVSIDDGRWAASAFMTGFGTGFFLAFFAGFFLIGGNGGGGCRWMSAVDVLGFKSESGELQQGKDDDFSSLFVEKVRGFFIETVL